MAVLDKFREAFGRTPTHEESSNNVATNPVDEKRDPVVDEAARGPESDETLSDESSDRLQVGVSDVEAITKSWTKASLIAVFLK